MEDYDLEVVKWICATYYSFLSKELLERRLHPHSKEIADFFFKVARENGLEKWIYRGISVEELEGVVEVLKSVEDAAGKWHPLWRFGNLIETLKDKLLDYFIR